MFESESRQVRRARERSEASPPKLTVQRLAGNRADRRAKRPDDSEIIIRPSRPLNAVESCKRTRRDYRIRHKLRAARGAIHPRTISHHRFTAMLLMKLIFQMAAERAEQRRAATA